MKTFENEFSLKRKVSKVNEKKSEKIYLLNLNLLHKVFDTVNFTLLVLIFILSFLSFNSLRKWSNTYKVLSKTKAINNNLIDFISKTEESYINQFESLNTFKKTTPEDLIYLNKSENKKVNYFNKKLLIIMNGFKDSRYQIGY